MSLRNPLTQYLDKHELSRARILLIAPSELPFEVKYDDLPYPKYHYNTLNDFLFCYFLVIYTSTSILIFL